MVLLFDELEIIGGAADTTHSHRRTDDQTDEQTDEQKNTTFSHFFSFTTHMLITNIWFYPNK